ncbi:hypothetical protein JXA70_04010 [candidate division KSB1 bacterium]|nr:hypothetical protein [candidate division KSB1 bacterium]
MRQTKNDKFLTVTIIVLSLAGLTYFGVSAIQSDHRIQRDNPFEYNIDNFAQSGASYLSYEQVHDFPLQADQAHALGVDDWDRIYVSDGNKIDMYDEQGRLLQSATAAGFIRALDVDVNKNIYLALESAVDVLDSTFTRQAMWPDLGSLAFLTSIAVGDTDVYVADAGQQVVWRYDKAGHLLNKIGEKDDSQDVPGFLIPSPYFDVLIDSDGYLWAVNTGRHQFENYLPDGSLRSSWQKSSMSIDGFSGCCNPAHAAMLPDGAFVTSEKGLLRIKIHNAIGELQAVVAMPDQFDNDADAVEVAVNSKEQIIVLDAKRQQVRIFQKKEGPT